MLGRAEGGRDWLRGLHGSCLQEGKRFFLFFLFSAFGNLFKNTTSPTIEVFSTHVADLITAICLPVYGDPPMQREPVALAAFSGDGVFQSHITNGRPAGLLLASGTMSRRAGFLFPS